MVLAIAAEVKYKIYMMNFQTTSIHADVEGEGLVKMPPGYERSSKVGVSLVMKLKENFYGFR